MRITFQWSSLPGDLTAEDIKKRFVRLKFFKDFRISSESKPYFPKNQRFNKYRKETVTVLVGYFSSSSISALLNHIRNIAKPRGNIELLVNSVHFLDLVEQQMLQIEKQTLQIARLKSSARRKKKSQR